MARRHHPRRYGRDGGGGKLAWVGGFILLPTIVDLLSRLFVKTGPNAALKKTGMHAAGLAASWWASKRFPQHASFLRGATWGEGLGTAFAGMSVATNPTLASKQATPSTPSIPSSPGQPSLPLSPTPGPSAFNLANLPPHPPSDPAIGIGLVDGDNGQVNLAPGEWAQLSLDSSVGQTFASVTPSSDQVAVMQGDPKASFNSADPVVGVAPRSLGTFSVKVTFTQSGQTHQASVSVVGVASRK